VPVLLVGHSYGGSVITAAGTADNVVGLVYISGFAPDEGENLTDLQSKFPAPGIIPYIVEHKLPEGGNEFTPSLVLRSPRPRRPRRGAAVRCGQCSRPPTGASTPVSTTSATSEWARR
jgi:pimeloyl-ACP methyl ester carboxylesterase